MLQIHYQAIFMCVLITKALGLKQHLNKFILHSRLVPKFLHNLNTDPNTCADGQFFNQELNKCQPCHISCTKCFGPSNNQCYECQNFFYLVDYSCQEQCDAHMYIEGKICKYCEVSCIQCYGPGINSCSKCIQNFILDGTTCRSSCQPGLYFSTQKNICDRCDSKCSICFGDLETQCIECSQGHYFDHVDTSCRQICPEGQFGNQITSQCDLCSEECTACTALGNDQCLSCAKGMYMFNGSCVTACPDGFDGSNPLKLCCYIKSELFNSKTQKCESQDLPKPPPSSDNTNCGSGQFKDSVTLSCVDCVEQCLKCTSITDCQQCQVNFKFDDNSQMCQGNCPNGSFVSNFDNQCQACTEGCVSCENEVSCNQCQDGYYPLENVDCGQCSDQCLTCFGPEDNQCFSCQDPFLYNPALFQCGILCSDGYQISETNNGFQNICFQCNPLCQFCTGPTSQECTACQIIAQQNGSVCSQICEQGNYFNFQYQICTPCHQSCKNCNGNLETQCFQCNDGLLLNNGKCVQTCDDGFYHNQALASCQKCSGTCGSCTGPDDSSCLNCKKNLFYLTTRKMCLIACPQGYYADKNDFICKNCPIHCRQCYGPTEKQCT